MEGAVPVSIGEALGRSGAKPTSQSERVHVQVPALPGLAYTRDARCRVRERRFVRTAS